MRRMLALLVTLLSISGAMICGISRVAYSEDFESILEKILNPLPDFDPFERPPAGSQFFPDEVDKEARALLIDALINDKEALPSHLKFLKEEDARRQKQYGSSTGLTDHAQDLINNTIADRDRYLAAQKEAIKNTATPERKKYLESIINNDDLTQADQLVRQNSANQWGGLFNRLLSSVDLVGVASGNYVGAAAETAIGQLYSILSSDMSVEERRALSRDLDHLKRYPNDPANAKIIKRIDELQKKKAVALVKKQLDQSSAAVKSGDLDKALFHAQLASYIDPQSKEVQAALQNVTQLSVKQVEAQRQGLAAKSEKPTGLEQQADARVLLEALTLRDADEIAREAAALEKKYRGKPLADAAKDASAVALEIQGRHEAAKSVIEQLIRSTVNPETQKHAETLLQSREYNLLASVTEARGERRVESMKYVLLGEDLLRKNMLYAAGAIATAGPAAAVTLGAMNALLVGNNVVNVLTNNPVSSQPIIDAAVAYVRNHPQSDDAAQVYKILGDAYEERGIYEKAIGYHQLAGSSKEKLDGLKEKAAKALLAAANNSKGKGSQEYYLTTLIDQYPESPAAADATKKLAKRAQSENQGLRMSKQFLLENPELVGPAGLRLKRSLFDGDPKNLELADRGINVTSENELLVYYQTSSGVRSQTYPLPRQTVDRFYAALREKNHALALADVDQRAKGSIGGIKNLPMPVVQGTANNKTEREEERDDATFAFVREAGGPSAFPQVLDHELLSENERDPAAKYKLPPIQGSISARGMSVTGGLPTGLWGNQLAIGSDSKSPFAGLQLPIPLLQGFIPVDFMVQGRPGGFSVYPKIHTRDNNGEDRELYK